MNGLFIKVALMVAIVAGATAVGHSQSTTVLSGDIVVSRFDSMGETALSSILRLADENSTPMGILMADKGLELAASPAEFTNTSLSTILDRLLANSLNYKWRYSSDHKVIIVEPKFVLGAYKRLIETRIDSFTLVDSTSNDILGILTGRVLSAWFPNQGVAMSILSSTDDPKYNIAMNNATVEEILNRLTILTKSTWIIDPAPPSLNIPQFRLRKRAPAHRQAN